MGRARTATLLFDLKEDPAQQHAVLDKAVEQRMIQLLLTLMDANECPPEQYQRLGLPVTDRSPAAIVEACVLDTPFGRRCAAHAGAGRLDALAEGLAN